MTPERWAQIRLIFDETLEREPGNREAYLSVVCAHDPELRREVDSLLHSLEESPEFLGAPAADLAAAFQTSGFAPASEDEPQDYPKGYRLGPYEIQRRIGRGGMGSVWLANRVDQEFDKRVAIKMVKRGMDSQEILRRFRLERQLLARLDHQNIAQLIDGGSTPEGLPYLVMEYVEGTPIDQYCDAEDLSVNERLDLFCRVCSAVQYAHQNLVVHRDIKASNILVNADGNPKLLDFGIAKVLRSSNPNDEAAPTRPDMRPMTLDYASPEQVAGAPVNTATDVYSLGVLLYKLLTGRMPFSKQDSRSEMEHLIRESEPLRPSDAVTVGYDQNAKGNSEAVFQDLKRLERTLDGDLDNIILMAMRKEPHRRYASVEQFSEDLQRYLAGRPVIARIDTPGYQLAKFVRRNAEGVAAAFVVGAALITIAAVASHSADIAIQGGLEAERKNRSARQELMETTRILATTEESAGNVPSAISHYRRAAEIAEELYYNEASLGGQPAPETRWALAQDREDLGRMLLLSGQTEEALQQLEGARTMYSELLTQDVRHAGARLALDRLQKQIAAVSTPPSEEAPPH